jgi:hypothetical protein
VADYLPRSSIDEYGVGKASEKIVEAIFRA